MAWAFSLPFKLPPCPLNAPRQSQTPAPCSTCLVRYSKLRDKHVAAARSDLPVNMPSAVITGTANASGIGRGLLHAFLKANYTCVGIDVNGHEGVAEDNVLTENKDSCRLLQADVSSVKQVDRATQEAVDFFGGSISCLINNAGIADPNLNGNKAQRLASWDKFIATNLSGPFYLTEACLDHMPAGKASIVHISSVRALQSEPSTEGYTAAKAGLCGMTRAQAVSLDKRARVNAILPGWIVNSPSLEVSDADRDWHLVGCLGQPDDIAQAALFLADPDKSGFITGQTLVVDGGVTCKLASIP